MTRYYQQQIRRTYKMQAYAIAAGAFACQVLVESYSAEAYGFVVVQVIILAALGWTFVQQAALRRRWRTLNGYGPR